MSLDQIDINDKYKKYKEFETAIRISTTTFNEPYEDQMEFVKQILQSTNEQSDENDSGKKTICVNELLMGKGKTSMITPLLVFHWLITENQSTVCIVLPSFLINQTDDEILRVYAYAFGAYNIVSYTLRSLVDIYHYQSSIKDATKRVILIHTELIKEIELRANIHNSKTDRKICRKYLDIFESSCVIFDEIHLQFRPSTSELNIPKPNVRLEQENLGELRDMFFKKKSIVLSKEISVFSFIYDIIASIRNNPRVFINTSESLPYIRSHIDNHYIDPDLDIILWKNYSTNIEDLIEVKNLKSIWQLDAIMNALALVLTMIYNKDYGFGDYKPDIPDMQNNEYKVIPYSGVNKPINGSHFSNAALAMVILCAGYIQRNAFSSHDLNQMFNDDGFSHILESVSETLGYEVKDTLNYALIHSKSYNNPILLQQYLKYFLPKMISVNLEKYSVTSVDVITSQLWRNKRRVSYTGTAQIVYPLSNKLIHDFPIQANDTYAKILKKNTQIPLIFEIKVNDLYKHQTPLNKRVVNTQNKLIIDNTYEISPEPELGLSSYSLETLSNYDYYLYDIEQESLWLSEPQSDAEKESRINLIFELCTVYKGTTIENLRNHLESNKYGALIDAGAITQNLSLEEVLEFLKDALHDNFEYIIYFDNGRPYYIHTRKLFTPKLLESRSYKTLDPEYNGTVFLFYSQQYCTGTDIKDQPNEMKGLVTINYFSITTDVEQAIFRLRKLQKQKEIQSIDTNGQSVDFIVFNRDDLNLNGQALQTSLQKSQKTIFENEQTFLSSHLIRFYATRSGTSDPSHRYYYAVKDSLLNDPNEPSIAKYTYSEIYSLSKQLYINDYLQKDRCFLLDSKLYDIYANACSNLDDMLGKEVHTLTSTSTARAVATVQEKETERVQNIDITHQIKSNKYLHKEYKRSYRISDYKSNNFINLETNQDVIRISLNAYESVKQAYNNFNLNSKSIYRLMNNFYIGYIDNTYLIISGHELIVLLSKLKENAKIRYIGSTDQAFEHNSHRKNDADFLMSLWLKSWQNGIDKQFQYVNRMFELGFMKKLNRETNYFKLFFSELYQTEISNIYDQYKTIDELKIFEKKLLLKNLYITGQDIDSDVEYKHLLYKIILLDQEIPQSVQLENQVDPNYITFHRTDFDTDDRLFYIYKNTMIAVRKTVSYEGNNYALFEVTKKPNQVEFTEINFEDMKEEDMKKIDGDQHTDDNYSYYIIDNDESFRIIFYIKKRKVKRIDDCSEYYLKTVNSGDNDYYIPLDVNTLEFKDDSNIDYYRYYLDTRDDTNFEISRIRKKHAYLKSNYKEYNVVEGEECENCLDVTDQLVLDISINRFDADNNLFYLDSKKDRIVAIEKKDIYNKKTNRQYIIKDSKTCENCSEIDEGNYYFENYYASYRYYLKNDNSEIAKIEKENVYNFVTKQEYFFDDITEINDNHTIVFKEEEDIRSHDGKLYQYYIDNEDFYDRLEVKIVDLNSREYEIIHYVDYEDDWEEINIDNKNYKFNIEDYKDKNHKYYKFKITGNQENFSYVNENKDKIYRKKKES